MNTQNGPQEQPPAREGLRERFLVGVSSMMFGTLVSQAVSFVAILLILRWVSQEEFGVYALILVLVQFLNIISELGIGSAVVRQIQSAHTDTERQGLISSAISATAVLCLSAGMLALVAKPLIMHLYDYELLDQLFLFILPILFLGGVNGLVNRLLQSLYAYKALLFVKLLAATSRFGLVVLFLKGIGTGVEGILLADVLGGVLVLVVSLVVLPGRPRLRLDRAILGPLVRFGFPIWLNAILTYIFARVDVLMIGNMTDADSVAAVEVARKIPDSLRLLLSASFMAVYYPSIARLLTGEGKPKAVRLTNASLSMMGFTISMVSVTLILLQNELVVWLFTEKYLFAAWAFSLFGMALLVGVMSSIMGMTLVAGGFSQAPLRVNVFIVLCNITGNYFLIPVWGLTGAALSSFASSFLSLPLNQWYLSRRLFRVYTWGFMAPVVLTFTYGAARHLLHLDSLLLRILLVATYPFVCCLISRPIREGVLEILRKGTSSWKEKWLPRA